MTQSTWNYCRSWSPRRDQARSAKIKSRPD